MKSVPRSVLTADGVAALLEALLRRGYGVIGPTVRDRAIVYNDIASLADLPRGWTDEQDGGSYRLRRRSDNALFGYAVGPHSWKKFLHTPAQRLWKAERGPDGLRIVPEPDSTERLAFVGVRACELHAIAIQDRVLLEGAYADPPHRDAMPEEVVVGDAVIAGAAARMARAMPAADEVPQLLRRNFENPRWEEVAGRCLTCGNCTMVCPTCFCTTVEEVSSLDGVESERMRHWDSCFTIDFSYLHGGSVRTSPRSRYRQWMTHKLSTWWDQFGSSGCVGCGRCITWCPVGIDITEEVAAIRGTDTAEAEQGR